MNQNVRNTNHTEVQRACVGVKRLISWFGSQQQKKKFKNFDDEFSTFSDLMINTG